eukprot:scaffold294_cov221-Amphora_coffeaeformis.AAC.9
MAARSQQQRPTNNAKAMFRRMPFRVAMIMLMMVWMAYQSASLARFYELDAIETMVLSAAQQAQQERGMVPQQLSSLENGKSTVTVDSDGRTLDVADATTIDANDVKQSQNDGFAFYYPTLHNDTTHFATEPWIDIPFLHILDTPLIQNQLNLTLLIESRLKLFEAFCVPSLRQQTSRHFIWIIRVDTRLSTQRPHWLQRLITLLWDDPRFYLVERDSNPSWRDGQASQQLARSKVYTGDQRRLEYYMAAYEQKHILETNLDGDDGLHYKYMEHIENKTLHILAQDPPPAFFHWCVPQEIEWHPVLLSRKPDPSTSIIPAPPSPYTHGLWRPGPTYGPKPPNNQDLCPSPGVTRVYPVGTLTEQVFRAGHHLLWRKFNHQKSSCTRPQDGPASPWKEAKCIQFVHLEEQDAAASSSYAAMRSRTPTSHSMVAVDGLIYGHVNEHYQQAHVYWNLTVRDFGLDPERMRSMKTHVVENLLGIAQEGLQGQCSKNHSCMVRPSNVSRDFCE